MMRLVVEGPIREKMVEEIKQVAAKSVAKVSVLKVELGGLCGKIGALAE